MFADWTDRIAAGELPPAPPRPQGIERNVVITQWDWADPKAYLHDVVSTDRRNPTVNANGPLYGALGIQRRLLPVLDPDAHTRQPHAADGARPAHAAHVAADAAPSPYWGSEAIWTSKNNVAQPACSTTTVASGSRPRCVRRTTQPFCQRGLDASVGEADPVARSGRHLAMYDPATKKLTHIGTCFGTHHLMFAEDANHTLWTSGGGPVVGWLNTKLFDETGDEERSQGWTALILDTNGNGKRDAYVEPNQPVDPAKDKRIGAGFYGVAPAPDGSVWGSTLGFPGAVIRLVPGSNPPETALAEFYEVPYGNPGRAGAGTSRRAGRHRSQRRRLGGAGERPHGQLRSAQVQAVR